MHTTQVGIASSTVSHGSKQTNGQEIDCRFIGAFITDFSDYWEAEEGKHSNRKATGSLFPVVGLAVEMSFKKQEIFELAGKWIPIDAACSSGVPVGSIPATFWVSLYRVKTSSKGSTKSCSCCSVSCSSTMLSSASPPLFCLFFCLPSSALVFITAAHLSINRLSAALNTSQLSGCTTWNHRCRSGSNGDFL